MGRYHYAHLLITNTTGKTARRSQPSQRERTKDWKLERQRETNEAPSFKEMLDWLKTTDGWTNAMEYASTLGLGQGFDEDSPEWEKSVEEELAEEQSGRYDVILQEMDNLDGEDCWRMLTLPEGMDPQKLAGVGQYWADDPDRAEAHWGDFRRSKRKVLLRARINSKNIDRAGMMYARMDLDLGEEEKEVRFLKHAPIWVYDATLDDGTVIRIDGWRRA